MKQQEESDSTGSHPERQVKESLYCNCSEPAFRYTFTESSAALNKAFDILFRETARLEEAGELPDLQ